MAPDSLPDPIAVALSVTELLELLGIRYLVGGSVASSVHGEPRSTNDVDIVADLRSEHVGPFLDSLGGAYYASRPAVEQAVRSGSSFNVIHMDTAVKVDVFVVGGDPFEEERLKRRARVEFSAGGMGSLYVDCAEYSVLRKLEWFRRGGEVSDRQWRDVVAILRVQGARLDPQRLETWAEPLGVSDLLEQARREAHD